jgi:hypothetical protein
VLYKSIEIPEIAKRQCKKIPVPMPRAVRIPELRPFAKDCWKIIAVSGPGDMTASR